ncbi:MAG: hypothetical protein IPL28_13240 [Chloroflexi bacterium]|nr:hypothetical protein [Chloroflexota bacterium]
MTDIELFLCRTFAPALQKAAHVGVFALFEEVAQNVVGNASEEGDDFVVVAWFIGG